MRKPLVFLGTLALLVVTVRSASGQSLGLTGSVAAGAPRFYGLSFQYSIWNSSTLNTHNFQNNVGQLFEPTWAFGKVFFRGTRFGGAHVAGRWLINNQLYGNDPTQASTYGDTGELGTCSNITPSQQGGQVDPNMVQKCPVHVPARQGYGDPWITFRVPRIVQIPKLKINVSPSFRFIIPVSLESRFMTSILTITPGIAFSRAFLDGKIGLSYALFVNKFFQESMVPRTNPSGGQLGNGMISQGYGVQSVSQFYNDPSFQTITGGANPNFSVLQIMGLSYTPHEKVSLSLLYILSDIWNYSLPCDSTVNGQPHDLCGSGQAVADGSGSWITNVGKNNLQVIWASIGYDPLDWLSLSLSWITWSPQRHPDGSLRQPFVSVDYNSFSSVNIGASISTDTLAAKFF